MATEPVPVLTPLGCVPSRVILYNSHPLPPPYKGGEQAQQLPFSREEGGPGVAAAGGLYMVAPA